MTLRRHGRRLVAGLALSAAVVLSPAAGAACDVGYYIEAVYAATAAYEPATISFIDLVSSTLLVTWASGSVSHRTVAAADTQKDGTPCSFPASAGQVFTAVAGASTNLLVKGTNLTESCRLLVVDSSEVCGKPTAVQHSAATSPPGSPIGVGDMYFFDVVLSTAGTYQLCFWSGYSVGGLGATDIASYATALGPWTVTDATTTSTTTIVAITSYSRRRGLSYTSATLRVDASSGIAYESITANPAAWNVHSPRDDRPTCRSCQRFSMYEVDRNVQELEVNRIVGFVEAAPGIASELGSACESTALANTTAPRTPSALLLARRGGCGFEEKARAAAAAGFSGLLVVNYLADTGQPLTDMALAGGSDAEASLELLPAWLLPKEEGDAIFELLAAGEGLTASVEDVERKARLSTSLSDALGVRRYETA